jgi:phage-related tail protein
VDLQIPGQSRLYRESLSGKKNNNNKKIIHYLNYLDSSIKLSNKMWEVKENLIPLTQEAK